MAWSVYPRPGILAPLLLPRLFPYVQQRRSQPTTQIPSSTIRMQLEYYIELRRRRKSEINTLNRTRAVQNQRKPF